MNAPEKGRSLGMSSVGLYKVFVHLSSDEFGEGVCAEHLWAERTFGGYRIANIPCHAKQITYGDVVRVDETTGEILSVVHSSIYRNSLVCYGSPSDGLIKERFARVRDALDAHGVLVEGMTPGVAGLAVPAEIADKEFWNIVKAIPDIISAELFEKKGKY